jgi:hypothetical protein
MKHEIFMSLIELWKTTPAQLQNKQIHQLIAFAGAGKLLDNSKCSDEFRTFLANVPSMNLFQYSEQCLNDSFKDSGLALQDIVNQVGIRLGADVVLGRYSGIKNANGYDGLWHFPNGHSIVVEVKTTDAYRIDLNTIAKYRQQLINDGTISEQDSSMLLVVGREDTGDLEAQIRGSRFAWDIRIISVGALQRLVTIKEEVDDPVSIQRIHNILIPREFTRLDEIADVLFSTTEDIKSETVIDDLEDEGNEEHLEAQKPKPVDFHDACIEKVKEKLSINIIKRNRSIFSDPEKVIALTCSVSKEHKPNTSPFFWFAFELHKKEYLEKAKESYVVLGCGDSKRVLLIPFKEFSSWLEDTATTQEENRMYWHIRVYRNNDRFVLHRKKGIKKIDLTKYLI